MRILAHRGSWENEQDKNTMPALIRALEKGYGIETDIRDYNGEIVISHNPPIGNPPALSQLLDVHKTINGDLPLALNVKADGLYLHLPELPKSAFLFDASIPEQYVYLKRGYKVFTRSSEFEPNPAFWAQSDGLWLDQFSDCGHIDCVVGGFLKSEKIICVVSPELHQREHLPVWEKLKPFKDFDNLFLCTDKPDTAKEFFK